MLHLLLFRFEVLSLSLLFFFFFMLVIQCNYKKPPIGDVFFLFLILSFFCCLSVFSLSLKFFFFFIEGRVCMCQPWHAGPFFFFSCARFSDGLLRHFTFTLDVSIFFSYSAFIVLLCNVLQFSSFFFPPGSCSLYIDAHVCPSKKKTTANTNCHFPLSKLPLFFFFNWEYKDEKKR